MKRLRLALVPLMAMCLAQLCYAQFDMPGMPDIKPTAVRSDVQYIRCQTCEAIVKQAIKNVKEMRQQLTGKQKLDESEILEQLETMCDYEKANGKWITRYDLVEAGDVLKMVDQGHPSKCNDECATIARACQQIMEDLDLTEISEALYAGKQRAAITNLACHDMSAACRTKPPPLPAGRSVGPVHKPMSEEEAQMEEMMARMKAQGLKGQLYNREMMEQQMEQMREQAEETGSYQGVPLEEIEKLQGEHAQGKEPAAGGGGSSWQQQLRGLSGGLADKVQQTKAFVAKQLQKVGLVGDASSESEL